MGTFISAYYFHFLQYLARFCQELVFPLHITTKPVELPCYATLFLQMFCSNRPQSVPASIILNNFRYLVPNCPLLSHIFLLLLVKSSLVYLCLFLLRDIQVMQPLLVDSQVVCLPRCHWEVWHLHILVLQYFLFYL